VAEVALAEVEHEEALHHDEEPLVGRLVEAELLLELLYELRIEALRAAVFGCRGVLRHLLGTSLTGESVARAAADARGRGDVRAGNLRDDPFDRSARCKLHDGETDDHDPEQR